MRCSRLLIHIWWQSTDTKLLPDVSFPFILHVLWGLWFLYVPTYDGRYMQTYQTWTTPPKDMPIWSLLGPRCSTTMALRWWVPTASGQEIWLWSLGAWGWQLGWCLYMFSREWPWIRSLFGNKFCTFCWPTPHFAYLKSNEIDLFWGSNWWNLVNSCHEKSPTFCHKAGHLSRRLHAWISGRLGGGLRARPTGAAALQL